jgi:hypothetical protein
VKEAFGIKGIPQLHVLAPGGKLITSEGRNLIAKDKEIAIQNWCQQNKSEGGDAFSTTEDF